jgi:hypothetical protein
MSAASVRIRSSSDRDHQHDRAKPTMTESIPGFNELIFPLSPLGHVLGKEIPRVTLHDRGRVEDQKGEALRNNEFE